MPTLSELQARVRLGKKLLAGDLPPGERMRVAKLTLLAEIRVMLRQKVPDFDEKMSKKPQGPGEPKQT